MASSETTQILFNSPALHSLKRDQLVKLCKIHSIKASGKNTELIQKLKNHAASLPHGSPLSVAARSEQPRDDDGSVSSKLTRNGQASSGRLSWRISQKKPTPRMSLALAVDLKVSLSSSTFHVSMFGLTTSSASSITSSLRAIATSFNFKQPPSSKSDGDRTAKPTFDDELAAHSVPYSSIPESSQSDMPQTDHFKFSTPDTTMDEHIPGQPGHPALPGPTATTGETTGPSKTTIRLVSASNSISTLSPEHGTPLLRPVDPPFDLVMGSPNAQGHSHVPVWPLSPHPGPSERLYPILPTDELNEARQRQTMSRSPGITALSQAPVSSAKVYPKPSDDIQDLFSPAPKQPGKPKEVRIEQGVRYRCSFCTRGDEQAPVRCGVQKVEADVFGSAPLALTAANANTGNHRALDKFGRFDKVHEDQFNKMDSIANHYAAKRGAPESKKRKSDVLGHGPAPDRKRMGIPGGFDEEEEGADEVQEEEDRRMSKRVRILEEDGGKDKGRRLTISSKKTKAEEKQAERERAATRKMLEVRKEKRRSSRHARTSLAEPQAMSNKGKATPRFGFLSSAKSMVRSVWNFGVGSPTKASRARTAQSKSTTAATGAAEPKDTKLAPPKKPSLAPARPSDAPPGRKSIAPARMGSTSSGKAAKGGASCSRPPSLSRNTSAKMPNLAPAGSTRSRQSVRAMSNGTAKTAAAASSSNKNINGNDDHDDKASIFSPSGTTSRLFAPTASSLAKMRGGLTGAAPTKSKTSTIVAQRTKTSPRNVVLDAITNSPRRGGGTNAGSPPGKKIFSTPLVLPSPKQAAVIPPPVKPTSLTAAATALATATATTTAATTTTVPATMVRSGGAVQSPEHRPTVSPSASTKTGLLAAARKPRISRSRIIAKLGAQRAAGTSTAASASASASASSRSSAAAAAGAGSKIPRASGGAVRSPRVRSSMGTATRRSYAGAKSASRGSDVLMSAKKHMRQSEYVRRRSRLAGSVANVGFAGADASHANGSMSMDIEAYED
ncbi:hypothetical protein BC826DRAFT_1108625 [Russula brevipes]|nr:hypothetical protein BC826DRAFT_1108625 [Russula brevipes]